MAPVRTRRRSLPSLLPQILRLVPRFHRFFLEFRVAFTLTFVDAVMVTHVGSDGEGREDIL